MLSDQITGSLLNFNNYLNKEDTTMSQYIRGKCKIDDMNIVQDDEPHFLVWYEVLLTW
jgi:hypothetical protein